MNGDEGGAGGDGNEVGAGTGAGGAVVRSAAVVVVMAGWVGGWASVGPWR